MDKYVALFVSLLVMCIGVYAYTAAFTTVGGWIIFFGLIFTGTSLYQFWDKKFPE